MCFAFVWLKESEEGADAAEARGEADEGEEPSDEDGMFLLSVS